jgi:N-glycosylase/DNA lyase
MNYPRKIQDKNGGCLYKLRNGLYMRQINKNTMAYNKIYEYTLERVKNKKDYVIFNIPIPESTTDTKRIVLFSPPLTCGRL